MENIGGINKPIEWCDISDTAAIKDLSSRGYKYWKTEGRDLYFTRQTYVFGWCKSTDRTAIDSYAVDGYVKVGSMGEDLFFQKALHVLPNK